MGYKDLISLQNISGTNDKKEFIKKHKDDEYFKKALYYIANPIISYNLSEKTIETYSALYSGQKIESIKWWINLNKLNNIFDLFDRLSAKKGIENENIKYSIIYLNQFEKEEKEVYSKMLSKTFKIGVTEKTINKIIPGLIPEWEVQQAYQLEKYPIKQGTEFWLTQKLNGVRATYYKGRLYARSGVPYKGLEHILKVLDEYPGEVVFDGELILKDKTGLSDNEAFRKSTGILNSDADSKPEIKYVIFDMISLSDFETDNKNGAKYSTRRTYLERNKKYLEPEDGQVEVLPVLYNGTNQDKIQELLDIMVKEDKEGLMLNLDVPYKKTRHKGILKVKRFYTMDLKIVDVEEGTGKLKGTLGSVVVYYKGNLINVGTGFTDEQRAKYWAEKENLIGFLCEVKYKEISSDKKTGLESLQFPVFMGLRTDKTTESYD